MTSGRGGEYDPIVEEVLGEVLRPNGGTLRVLWQRRGENYSLGFQIVTASGWQHAFSIRPQDIATITSALRRGGKRFRSLRGRQQYKQAREG